MDDTRYCIDITINASLGLKINFLRGINGDSILNKGIPVMKDEIFNQSLHSI